MLLCMVTFGVTVHSTEITESFAQNTNNWLLTASSQTSTTAISPNTNIQYTYAKARWFSGGDAILIEKSGTWKFTLSQKCTQIKLTLTAKGTPSTKSKIEITGNNTSCGAAQTLSSKGATYTYDIPTQLQAAGTEYSLIVTNANTQLSQITYVVEDGNVSNKESVSLTWPAETMTYTIGDAFTSPVLTVDPEAAKAEVVYSIDNQGSNATIDKDGVVTPGTQPGTAIITAKIAGSQTYQDKTANYTLRIKKPIPANAIQIDFLTSSNDNGTNIAATTKPSAIFEAASLEYLAEAPISSFNQAYYNSTNGLKLGSSGNLGNVTVNLAKPYKISSIIAAVAPWSGKTSSVTINEVNNTFNTASEDLEYVYVTPQITDQLVIKTVNNGDNRAYVKSLIIVYEEIETVATPTITPAGGDIEADSDITIACATEGATLHYAWGEEAAAELTGNTVKAQAGTLAVYATKEGMQQSETATATFTIKLPVGTAPAMPVVTADNGTEIANDADVTLPYGTQITVTSTGADMLGIEINDTPDIAESNTYSFTLTEDVICSFYGSNDNGEGETITFSASVAKADLVVKFGETEVAAGQTYTVAEGTKVTLTTTTGTTLNIFDADLETVATTEGKSLDYTIAADCTLTFEATTPAANTSTSIDEVVFAIKVPVTYGDFTLVTSTDQVIADDYYTVVYSDTKSGTNYAMSNQQTGSGNKYLKGAEISIVDNVFASTEETLVFVLEETDGKYYFRTENFGETPKYFQGMTGDGNNEIKFIDTPDTNSEVVVTIDENNLAEILFTNATYDKNNKNYTRSLQFNKQQDWFGLYGSPQGKPALYKKELVIDAPAEAHNDTHFVLTTEVGNLYVKEYDGLKPGTIHNPTPQGVHTPAEGFNLVEGGTWQKEKNLEKDMTVEAYVEHKGRMSNILSINLHPDGTTTTGIENVEADGNQGDAVLYNLQGMRVNAATAPAGIYVRLQGNRAHKVVIR